MIVPFQRRRVSEVSKAVSGRGGERHRVAFTSSQTKERAEYIPFLSSMVTVSFWHFISILFLVSIVCSTDRIREGDS